MINLRYHIVSITAVFLALGIGVALGSTLIQRGLVDTLNDRLDEQADRLDRTDGENADLRDELQEIAELDERMTTEASGLYAGHLVDVPVVVIASTGVDEALVELTRRSIRDGGATVHGVLRFTSRWTDLDDGEVEELAELTGRAVVDPDLARTRVMRDLAAELLAAAEPEPEPEPPTGVGPEDEGDGTTETGSEGEADGPAAPVDGAAAGAEVEAAPDDLEPTTTTTTPPPEPNGLLLAALVERGYLEFLPDESADPLPAHGARYVVVETPESDVPPEAALVPLLQELAAADPAPVVVIEPLAELDQEATEEAGDTVPAGELVSLVRGDPQMRLSITTVDVPRRFLGQAATVLALAGLNDASAVVGHYGVAEGAGALLPATAG